MSTTIALRGWRVCIFFLGAVAIFAVMLGQRAPAADVLLPLDLRQVKVGGEIG